MTDGTSDTAMFHPLCTLLGHKSTYTDEYRNQMNHVQADEVCLRCGQSRIAWTGPPVDEIEEACSIKVPTKEEAHDAIQ